MSHIDTFDYPKDPNDTKEYSIDWRDWLAGNSIQSYTLTANGVTLDSHTQADGIVTMLLSGGVDGNNAVITCRVTPNNNLEVVATKKARLLIRE